MKNSWLVGNRCMQHRGNKRTKLSINNSQCCDIIVAKET